jgi:hypothetical protein
MLEFHSNVFTQQHANQRSDAKPWVRLLARLSSVLALWVGQASVALISTLSSKSALAQDFGVHVGLRSDFAEGENSSTTVTGKSNFQLGVISKFDVHEKFQVRTGFMYLTRSFDIKGSTNTQEARLSYFEIPLAPLYKFDEFGGIFAGLNFGFNLAKDCSGVTCKEVNASPMSFQLGASYLFAPNFGFEVFFEQGLNQLTKELNSPRAVAAGLLITFE